MSNRIRPLLLTTLLSLLPFHLWAFTPSVGDAQVDPNGIFTQTPTQVTFTSRVAVDPKHIPAPVQLLRLQATGGFQVVSAMWDDGSNGDRVKGDGIYTCTLAMKEPQAGLLSFYVEASYPGMAEPVRSHPMFISVIGGVTKKDKKALLKTQKQADELLQKIAKEKGLEEAKKETMAWLSKQPTVSGVTSTPGEDIFVQYKAGVAMTLHPVPPLGFK
jgi:hypothetical protein